MAHTHKAWTERPKIHYLFGPWADVSAGLHSTLESSGDPEASEEIPQKQDQSTKLPEKRGGKQAKSKFFSSRFFYVGWARRQGSDLGGTYPFQMIQSKTFLSARRWWL